MVTDHQAALKQYHLAKQKLAHIEARIEGVVITNFQLTDDPWQLIIHWKRAKNELEWAEEQFRLLIKEKADANAEAEKHEVPAEA